MEIKIVLAHWFICLCVMVVGLWLIEQILSLYKRYETFKLQRLLKEKIKKAIEVKVECSHHTQSKCYSTQEIEQLQTKVHKITGDGEVMGLFNEMLGISAS